MIKKKLYKDYLFEILKKNPSIKSGRKNYSEHEKRIEKTIKLIKDFKNKV